MKKLYLLLNFIVANFVFAQIQNPESVIWNEATGTYIISDASQGILFSMTADREVTQFTTDLTSPKGIVKGSLSLWVTDVNKIIEIDMISGAKLNEYDILNAQFLNDIVYDPLGYLYISDMQTNKIYEFDEIMRTAEPVSNGQMIAPNGLSYDNLGGLIIVSFTPNAKIYTMDLMEGNVEILKETNLGQLDGIAYDSKRDRYYISAWQQGAVYIFDSGFMDEPQLLLDGLNGPADIYYDENRDILVIPEMNTGEIIFYDFNETNIEEDFDYSFGIFPNPARDYLEIKFPTTKKIYNASEVKIYNYYGECVMTLTPDLSQRERELRIDISQLPVGIYFIQVGNYLEKFMVIR